MTISLADQNIIAMLGIESLPDERKVAVVERASELVQKRLLLRVLDSFTPEQREEFGKLLDSNNEASVQAFIDANVHNLPELIGEEVAAVKSDLKTWMDDTLGE